LVPTRFPAKRWKVFSGLLVPAMNMIECNGKYFTWFLSCHGRINIWCRWIVAVSVFQQCYFTSKSQYRNNAINCCYTINLLYQKLLYVMLELN
jgi:hypothetical protein